MNMFICYAFAIICTSTGETIMDIFSALTEHHEELRSLFTQVADGETPLEILLANLEIHHRLEENILLMPAVERVKDSDEAREAIEEHHVIDFLMSTQKRFPRDDERWEIKLHVFEEFVLHHLEEEEEDVFPSLAEEIDEDEAEEMGERFREKLSTMLECR